MQPDSDKHEWKQPTEQPSQAPYAVPPSDDAPTPAPVVSLSPDNPVATDPTPPKIVEEEAQADPATEDTPSAAEDEPVRWQAHEYIHHEKNTVWFIVFAVVVIVFMLVAIFLIKEITFIILIPVMAVALLVYSHRPPRVLNYTLSRQGLHVNDRLYPFSQFRGFGVIRDGEEYSIMLIPVKRFQPGVSVYFPEEAGEAIVDMLGVRLPMQELHLDIIDKLIRKLRI